MMPTKAPAISATPATSTDGCYAVTWGTVTDGAWYVTQEQVNFGAFTDIDNDRSGRLQICGKTNGNYAYRVMACNVSGCGPGSTTVNVKVLLVPSTPDGLNVTRSLQGTTYKFQGNWSAVDTAPTYQVQKGGATVYTGGSTTYLLQTGTGDHLLTTFQLRACNASGCSAYVQFPNP
ncbi:hypothetical protein ABIE56_000339 [Luteibacter sp. 621]|uniref:hypothetical protein n=1 Tax=Luteibacter sp. 621 TaxID=3373916 RepID=UPI003D1E359A